MSQTDVFYCSADVSALREQMRMLCLMRWAEEPYVAVRIVLPRNIGSKDGLEFQRDRRIYADENADSDIYVVADDDCLLESGYVVNEAIKILERHPDFAVLSLTTSNQEIGPWTGAPDGYQVFEDDEVLEHGAVGGIRFCRKGSLLVWPALVGFSPRYDGTHCEALRAVGYRVGFYRNLRMNHIGHTYSQTKPRPGLN